MEDITDLVQNILSQIFQDTFPENSKLELEIIPNVNPTHEKPTQIEIERKLSEISAISSGFEDSCSKTTSEDVEFRTSTPENRNSSSYEEFFNDTIEEAINKYELAEKFKEASVQTSPSGIDRECQCDLIVKISEPLVKKIKTEVGDCNSAMVATTEKENKRSERVKECEKFQKQTPRIRVGLSKRARLQPLHSKLMI